MAVQSISYSYSNSMRRTIKNWIGEGITKSGSFQIIHTRVVYIFDILNILDSLWVSRNKLKINETKLCVRFLLLFEYSTDRTNRSLVFFFYRKPIYWRCIFYAYWIYILLNVCARMSIKSFFKFQNRYLNTFNWECFTVYLMILVLVHTYMLHIYIYIPTIFNFEGK